MKRNGNDPNKTLKLAQKRAYVDAVLRTVGLSDLFTQDLEDMDPDQIKEAPEKKEPDKYESWMDDLEAESSKPIQEDLPPSGNLITEKQRKLLISLSYQKCDEEEREMILGSIDSMDKSEASHMIKSLIEQ